MMISRSCTQQALLELKPCKWTLIRPTRKYPGYAKPRYARSSASRNQADVANALTKYDLGTLQDISINLRNYTADIKPFLDLLQLLSTAAEQIPTCLQKEAVPQAVLNSIAISLPPPEDGSFQEEFLGLMHSFYALEYTPPQSWIQLMDQLIVGMYCTTTTTDKAVTSYAYPLNASQTVAFMCMLIKDVQASSLRRSAPYVALFPLLLESRYQQGTTLLQTEWPYTGSGDSIPAFLERYYAAVRAAWANKPGDWKQFSNGFLQTLLGARAALPLVRRWSWAWDDKAITAFVLIDELLTSDEVLLSGPEGNLDTKSVMLELLTVVRTQLARMTMGCPPFETRASQITAQPSGGSDGDDEGSLSFMPMNTTSSRRKPSDLARLARPNLATINSNPLLNSSSYDKLLTEYKTQAVADLGQETFQRCLQYLWVINSAPEGMSAWGVDVTCQLLGAMQVSSRAAGLLEATLVLDMNGVRVVDKVASETSNPTALLQATVLLAQQPDAWKRNADLLRAPVLLLTRLANSPRLDILTDEQLMQLLQAVGQVTAYTNKGKPISSSNNSNSSRPGEGREQIDVDGSKREDDVNITVVKMQKLMAAVDEQSDGEPLDLLARIGIQLSSGLAGKSAEEQAAALEMLGIRGMQ